MSATSKIGAAASLSISSIVPTTLTPVRCWSELPMPVAAYRSGTFQDISAPGSLWRHSRIKGVELPGRRSSVGFGSPLYPFALQ